MRSPLRLGFIFGCALFGCVFEATDDDYGLASGCEGLCGPNAYCDYETCVCAPSFVSACGTDECIPEEFLCDGVADCGNAGDENPVNCSADIEQTWLLIDACGDGADIEWRLWSQTQDWAWPGPDEAFVTPGDGFNAVETIACLEGDLVCLGARSAAFEWGVGLEGTLPCENCCYICGFETVDFGALECG